MILDPNNGQVIAMASYPDFDPSEFTKPIPSDRWASSTTRATSIPLNNRALQGEYAPGSTFKLVTALAGLRTGAITPQTTINDTGAFHVPGCTGDAVRVQELGRSRPRVGEPAAARITVSSDFYFYSLGAQFWTDSGHVRRPDPGDRAGSRVRTN